ncbi:hypothetical protein [Nonomuraea sp. CA-141351]
MTEGFESDTLWDELHRPVNMNSEELRAHVPPDPELMSVGHDRLRG